jgi:hypothetical protein
LGDPGEVVTDPHLGAVLLLLELVGQPREVLDFWSL